MDIVIMFRFFFQHGIDHILLFTRSVAQVPCETLG